MSYRQLIVPLMLWLYNVPSYDAYAQTRSELIFYATDASNALASFEQHAAAVSVIAPQSYRLTPAGELTGAVPDRILRVARARQVRVMPLIVNQGWDAALFRKVANDPVARRRMITQMVELGRRHGYWGWQFDFEGVHVGERDALTRFYREAAQALHAAGLRLSIAVYPDPDPQPDSSGSSYHTWLRENYTGAYDLKALAEAGDFISLMTYLQHGAHTPPGPPGGLPYIERVIEHALSLGIPRGKLSLGVPLFSLHWAAHYSQEKQAHVVMRGLGWPAMRELLQKEGAEIVWDSIQGSSQARWEQGGTLEHAWVEDARAFNAKLAVQRKYALRGISVWRIGQEDPAVWQELRR